MTFAGHIAELWIHPIKGCRGIALDEAWLEPMGLADDRRWMIVDAVSGRFLSQRELPQLARIVPVLEQGTLAVAVPGAPSLDLPRDGTGEPVRVSIWRDELTASAPSVTADGVLSTFLGRSVRIVRFDERHRRACDPAFAGQHAHTGFADGFPLLVTSEGSLGELNDDLAEAGEPPLPMRRFRPNIVVSGVPARAEDRHGWLAIGDLVLDLVKPCDRCIVTTTDQETGLRTGQEPLRTLGRIRRNTRTAGVWFGQNAVARLRDGERATIRKGEPCRFEGAPGELPGRM